MRKYLILGLGCLQSIITTICLILPLSINTLAESFGLNNTQIQTPLFGQTTINIGAVFDGSSYNQTPSPQQLTTPQSEIWSFSVKDSVIYGIGTEEKRKGCTINQTLTPLEIKKIMQSMTWL